MEQSRRDKHVLGLTYSRWNNQIDPIQRPTAAAEVLS